MTTTNTSRLGALAVAAFAAFVSAGGCAWTSHRVEGSGKAIEDKRAVENFTAVEIGGSLKGEIIVGEPFSVVVKGDDNLVPLVQTKLDGNQLEVEVKNRVDIRPKAGLSIIIRMPKLERAEASGASELKVGGATGPQLELEASGASHLHAAGVSGDALKVGASGASEVKLGGGVAKLEVDLSGASSLAARELTARTADVDVSGASNADVTSQEAVSGSASGASSVRVWGNPPKLAVDTSGASSVKSMP